MGETLFQRVLELFYGTMTFECLGFFFGCDDFSRRNSAYYSQVTTRTWQFKKKCLPPPPKNKKVRSQIRSTPQKTTKKPLMKWKKHQLPSYIHILPNVKKKHHGLFSRASLTFEKQQQPPPINRHGIKHFHIPIFPEAKAVTAPLNP